MTVVPQIYGSYAARIEENKHIINSKQVYKLTDITHYWSFHDYINTYHTYKKNGTVGIYGYIHEYILTKTLEYLNSVVTIITHIYKTISTRGDTVWTIKLSLLMTTPPK